MKTAARLAGVLYIVWLVGVTMGVGINWISDADAYPIIDGGTVKNSAGYPSFGADISVSITSTSTTSGLASLTPGLYVIVCTQAVHVDQGVTGVVAATTERLIPAYTPYPMAVLGGGANDNFLAIVRASADGTCIVSRDIYQ